MNNNELAAIEARQKAATPPGRVIFESEIIEKDVPKLIQALQESRLQLNDAKSCLQDLRDLLAEQPKECSRPFILGAQRRLKEFEQRWGDKRNCVHGLVMSGNLCLQCGTMKP